MWNLIEKTVCLFLQFFYKIIGKELTQETVDGFVQFVKFGVVGVSNTIVCYLLYTAGLLIFRKTGLFDGRDYLAAQVFSFVLSVLWSFYWNNKTVFVLEEGKDRSVIRSLCRMYVSYSFTGLFLNTILIYVWVSVFHISAFIAPLISLPVTVPVNFVINKFWAFKS